MSTKAGLRLLDLDEDMRASYEATLGPLIQACKVLGLTLDAASSDVVLFVENEQGESICIG